MLGGPTPWEPPAEESLQPEGSEVVRGWAGEMGEDQWAELGKNGCREAREWGRCHDSHPGSPGDGDGRRKWMERDFKTDPRWVSIYEAGEEGS